MPSRFKLQEVTFHVSSKLFVILLLAISWVMKGLTRRIHHYFCSSGVVKNVCNFTGTHLIIFMALVVWTYCVQNVQMRFQRKLKKKKIYKHFSVKVPIEISKNERINMSPCCNSNSIRKVCTKGKKRQKLSFLQNSRTFVFFKISEP